MPPARIVFCCFLPVYKADWDKRRNLSTNWKNIPDKNILGSRDVMRVLVSLNFNSGALSIT